MPKETSKENGSARVIRRQTPPSSRLAADYVRQFGHPVPIAMEQTGEWPEKARKALETGKPVPEWKLHAESPWNGTVEGMGQLPLSSQDETPES